MNAKHYFFEDNEKNPGYGDVANMECIAADVSLAGVKFAFDRQYSAMTECDMGSLELIFASKRAGPSSSSRWVPARTRAATPRRRWPRSSSSRKLGLERAAPAELVASLLAAICPNPRLAPVLLRRLRRRLLRRVAGEPPHTHGSHRHARGPVAPPRLRQARGAARELSDAACGRRAKMREVSSSDSEDGGESGAFIENPFHPENVRVYSFMEEYRGPGAVAHLRAGQSAPRQYLAQPVDAQKAKYNTSTTRRRRSRRKLRLAPTTRR